MSRARAAGSGKDDAGSIRLPACLTRRWGRWNRPSPPVSTRLPGLVCCVRVCRLPGEGGRLLASLPSLTRVTAAMQGLHPAGFWLAMDQCGPTSPTQPPPVVPFHSASRTEPATIARRLPLPPCLRSFLVLGAVSIWVYCFLSHEGMTTLPSLGACRLGPPCSLFFPSTVVV